MRGSAVIKAICIQDDWFDSPIVSASTRRAPWTINECLDCYNLVFATGGDSNWRRDLGTAYRGEASYRSGIIGNNQTNWLETVVHGEGTLNFKWKVNSETFEFRGQVLPCDSAMVWVDDECVGEIYGDEGWTDVNLPVRGDGMHTIRWVYRKDGVDEEWIGEDCVWVDAVRWMSGGVFPEIPNDLSEEDVASAIVSALEDAADAENLAANITTKATYDAFRAWAETVKGADGAVAGAAAVKDAAHAWLSFALDSAVLIGNEPQAGDVTVDAFAPVGEDGAFELAIGVKGVEVGAKATAENLAKVFRVEGGTTLGAFAEEAVELVFGKSEDGKVRVSIAPKDKAAKSFFVRVLMTP